MDEIWERAVSMALDGKMDTEATRILTLDGAVKCIHGRLPRPSLLGKFENLQHLSLANIGVTSLEQFPRLQNLQKLILSDNRIAGGLEFLVEAELVSLRDLDLSNNRIQYIEDLAPLAQLRLVSLDLYECPVTRVKDYRARVFGLIKSLKYLDKMDAEENERPESDEEEEEEEDEEDDPGSGEIDGEDRPYNNGHRLGCEGVVDVDEDEESEADEEETESSRRQNGLYLHSNGFHVSPAVDVEDDDDEDDDDEDVDSAEEIDEEGDEDVVEVHDIVDSEEEDDGVEYDEEDDDDDDNDENGDGEEVENGGGLAEPESTGRSTGVEGEIDGHEQGEDDNGETGEEEQGIEDDGDFEDDEIEEEEDSVAGYLVQPVRQAGGSRDADPRNGEEDLEEDEVEEEEVEDVQELPSSSSLQLKRKRGDDELDEGDDDDDNDDNGDDDGDDDGEDDEDNNDNGNAGYAVTSPKGRP